MSAVMVVSHRTTSAQQEALDDACSRAGVSCVRWHRGDAPLFDSSLVVAGLGVGERVIPSEVVELVDAVGESATLLLLTSEPLVRPSVTLQRGRVVVVGGPQRAERLYGFVRRLAIATPGEAESVKPWSWSAELAPSSPVSRVDERALTAIIPIGDDVEIDESLRSSAADCMTQADGLIDEARLQDLLGSRAGLVHLSAYATSWLVYWPRTCGARQRDLGDQGMDDVEALWLYSTARLPRLYDLRGAATAAHPRLLRLAAQSGDTLLAMAGATALDEDAVGRAMAGGGPGLLSTLREHERTGWGSGLKPRGVVVEVR